MSGRRLHSTIVLLEGRSDVSAVRAVATTLGVTEHEHRFRLVDMGGVTNIRRCLSAVAAGSEPIRIVGMCDADEAHVVAEALGLLIDGADQQAALAERGFFLCAADLEDELIRAAGPDRVLDLLEPLGLRARFATFQHQPEWRERRLHQQLRRFAGTTSGRKALFAGALGGELAPHEVPAPLLRLVTRIAEAPSSSDVSARNG